MWHFQYHFVFALILALFLGIVFSGQVKAATTASVRSSDGTVVINGNPIFLFGFYHDSEEPNDQRTNLVTDLQTIDSAGFNVIHPTITELEDTVEYRSKAVDLGMWSIATFYRPALESVVKQLKDDASIFAWDIADDFSSPPGNPKLSPEAVKTRHNQVKAIDPTSLTYGAAGANPVYHNEKYLGSVDVMGLEAYPIGNLNGPYETELEDSIGTYLHNRKSMPAGQALIALPQTFAWPNKRWPTASEVRNMTYGALIARMNGVMYYTYGSASVGKLSSRSELWNEVKALKQDIDVLTPALLSGTYTQYDALKTGEAIGKGRVHAGFWQKDGITYVVVLNTATSAQTVSIPVPGSSTGVTLTPLFAENSRYQQTLQLESGNLKGSITSGGVSVYQIKQSMSPSPSSSPFSSPKTSPSPKPTPSMSPVSTPVLTPTPTPTPSSSISPSPTSSALEKCLSTADLNQDGKLSLFDYTILATDFLKQPISNQKSDLNHDGSVNLLDYSILISCLSFH